MNAQGRLRSYLPMLTVFLVAGMPGVAEVKAQAQAECPLHAQHVREGAASAGDRESEHEAHDTAALDEVDARGDQVMGFSHTAATHHFLLTSVGGAIEVGANDPGDAATRALVRAHLQRVASDFRAGNFSMPRAVHDRVPAGVETMRAKGAAIGYRYRETAAGGRVELTGADDRSRAATLSCASRSWSIAPAIRWNLRVSPARRLWLRPRSVSSPPPTSPAGQ